MSQDTFGCARCKRQCAPRNTSRGLCNKCYFPLWHDVKRGRITWELAESQGLCLPKKPTSGRAACPEQRQYELLAQRLAMVETRLADLERQIAGLGGPLQ